MKKLILLTAAFLTVSGISAYADTVENINITRNTDAETVVSGNLSVEKVNHKLILTVTHEGDLITAEQTTVKETRDGKAYFEFEPILFPYDAPSGYYTYTVSGTFIDNEKSVTDTKLTVGTDDFYTHITALNSLIGAGNETGAYEYLINNSDYLDIDKSYLDSVTSGLPVFKKLLLDKQFACTAGDYESIEKARGEFSKRYSDIISIAKFYQINSLTAYNEWLTNNSQDFPNEVNDGEEMYSYYSRITDTKMLSDKITALNNAYLAAGSFKGFDAEKANTKKIFYEGVFLTNIYANNAAVAQNIVTGYPDYFITDNTYYNDLTAQKKGEVFNDIKGVSYDSAKAVCDDFYKYSKQLYDSSSSGKGSGSSSSGSSSSGAWGNISGIIPNQPTQVITPDDGEPFNDIAGVQWAKEAILELYERKIISGKAERIFAPNDNVTRAEFLKMIVLAADYDIIAADQKPFGDVDTDKWYADVVNTAKEKGLITGDENNNFNPDMQITRQDMSIIVARALGYSPDGEAYAPFGDLETIDDYAVEYVVYLYKKGLLKGNEDGLFLPKDNTRRSEAAVLIHRLLSYNEL